MNALWNDNIEGVANIVTNEYVTLTSEEDKQKYWNTMLFLETKYSYNDLPKSIADFIQEEAPSEWKDFYRFLPWIAKACDININSIEDIFILDDEAREYLFKHAPELLKKYRGEEIHKFINDTKNNVKNSLQNEE